MARSTGDGEVRVLPQHPCGVFVPHLCFKCLVISDVDRLHESRAAGGDVLDLYAETLDGVDDRRHHVAGQLVEEEKGDDPRRRLGRPRSKDDLDPVEHHLLVEPRLLVDAVEGAVGECRELPLSNPPLRLAYNEGEATINRLNVSQKKFDAHFDLPLKMIIDGS